MSDKTPGWADLFGIDPDYPVEPEPSWRIEGTWLVIEVDRHTCGTGPGGYYGAHEPGCGLEPVVDLSTLPGWDALTKGAKP